MYETSSKIGINTTTPEELLDINGNIRIRESNSAKFGGTG